MKFKRGSPHHGLYLLQPHFLTRDSIIGIQLILQSIAVVTVGGGVGGGVVTVGGVIDAVITVKRITIQR